MALQELTSYYISLSGATAEKNCCVASALKVLFQREVQKSTDSEYKKLLLLLLLLLLRLFFHLYCCQESFGFQVKEFDPSLIFVAI